MLLRMRTTLNLEDERDEVPAPITALPVFDGDGLAPGVTEADFLSNARMQERLEPSDEIRRELGLE